MALFHISGIKISGLSSCLPKKAEDNSQLGIDIDDIQKLINTTGIVRRRIASVDTTTSDLCYEAAKSLIEQLGWIKDEIGCLIFVTQTPDYILPATSCILQHRLGLNEECYCLDISLGCSGWIYGLNNIASVMKTGNIKKGLLLVGDTISKFASDEDKSTWPLFGDAGTCTALELDDLEEGLLFHTATDGSGFESIIITDGGFRNPISSESLEKKTVSEGIKRNQLQLILDGMNVFTFGISKAPESVRKLIDVFGLNKDEIDLFLFHQANKFMNEKIRKKLKVELEKVPYSLSEYGNTSSATIPLTLLHTHREKLSSSHNKIIACGFGVGLSWGSVYFQTKNIVCPEIVQI